MIKQQNQTKDIMIVRIGKQVIQSEKKSLNPTWDILKWKLLRTRPDNFSRAIFNDKDEKDIQVFQPDKILSH